MKKENKSLLQCQNLTYTTANGKKIIEDFNLEIHSGKLIGVLGPNGSGKTTLLDLLMGLRPRSSGQLFILGCDFQNGDYLQLQEVTFVSQEISVKKNIRIQDFLDFYSEFYSKYSKREEQNLLALFKINPQKMLSELSTGHIKLVHFIAATSSLPKILIIDELTAVLDGQNRKKLFETIQQHKDQRQMTTILATNIAEDLIGQCDQIIHLQDCGHEILAPTEIFKFLYSRTSA